jgi:hypothetical protein
VCRKLEIETLAYELSIFPLQTLTHEDLQKLAHCLWRWQLCGACHGRPVCFDTGCPWSRAAKLGAFWSRYRRLTGAYVPEFFTDTPALTSHADVFNIIRIIKEFPHITREQLLRRTFGQGVRLTSTPAKSDTSHAINLAASVILLTGCGMWKECGDTFEDGTRSLPWQDNVSARDSVAVAFPPRPASLVGKHALFRDNSCLA